jgi:mono/diheme cytochrome c family protein
MKNFFLGVVVTLVVTIVGGYFYLTKGYMDCSADRSPSSMERHMAMSAMDAATARRAPVQPNPVAATEGNLIAGAKLYVEHCAGCHGLPSNPESKFSRAFNPPTPGFFKRAPDMPDNQNFYITQHGIRWTGMPAWSRILTDEQMWKIVTFMSKIEKLPAAARAVLEPPAPGVPAAAPSH